MNKEAKKFLRYIMRKYCPHDIVPDDYAVDFTEAHCIYENKAYSNPCAVCWDKFLVECFEDEVEE